MSCQRRLLAASQPGAAKVCDATTGAEVFKLTRQKGARAVAWSRDGKRMAAGGSDGSVILWDAQTGAQSIRLAAHKAEVLLAHCVIL